MDRPPRRPPALDAAALERAALDYLGRYAASTGQLRRVLQRRIRRARQAGAEVDVEAVEARITALLERMVRSKLLDDAQFAEMRIAGLARRGRSTRAIRVKLREAGIDETVAADALSLYGGAPGADPDRAAAIRLARRRRLGPFRAEGDRTAHRMRDLAALGRAGFAPGLCRAVIDAPDAAALEAAEED
ncbi:RecX family transcriptional regulator [Inquilinus sp.]|jgi:regulatory protein|uniref:RecX family transcriptional regulator n=1 Tax=Inquilinus sp. TaxID=1932117 RepID=UPI003784F520